MAALNVEIPDGLKKDLARACIDRNTKLKPAVTAAIQAWLKASGLPKPESPMEDTEDAAPASRNSPCERKLAKILASGDQAVIDAVTQNIDVLYDRLRPTRSSEPGSHRKAG